MLTDEEIKEYFASLGVTLPDSMISCITSQVNKAYDCLIDNGADECAAKLALLMASGLIGISMGARMISSESVDVLSHSFTYKTLSELQTLLGNNLSLYDPWGCTSGLIPTSASASFLFGAVGCRR